LENSDEAVGVEWGLKVEEEIGDKEAVKPRFLVLFINGNERTRLK